VSGFRGNGKGKEEEITCEPENYSQKVKFVVRKKI
jgi:hypothetical protein